MKWFALAAVCCWTSAQAFVPSAGTWVVNEEVNGKPGRGLAIDVQNHVLVMQMYAYEQNGQPTFYMGSGNLNNQQATMSLNRYQGGRYLGSGDRSGVERGSPGNVRIRFTSGTQGLITLPGEGEKVIKRFQFGYDNTPQALLGLWSVVYANEAGKIEHDPIELTRVTNGSSFSNGMAVSYDGLFACEQMIRGTDAGKTQCVKFRSSTSSESVRSFVMQWSVNMGEGDWRNTNGSDLGAVYANRLMQNSGRITGILRKVPVETSAEQVNNDAALRAALESLAAAR